MKTIKTLLVASLLPASLLANPNLQVFPESGEEHLVHKSTISEVQFEPMNTGMNASWEINLPSNTSTFEVRVKKASTHPDFNQFKKADIVIENDYVGNALFDQCQESAVFYDQESAHLHKVGRVDRDTVKHFKYVSVFEDSELKMKDLVYEGQEFEDTWSAGYLDPVNGTPVEWNDGMTTVNVIAQGELVYNGVRIPNVFLLERLRTHTEKVSGKVDIEHALQSYEWWSAEFSFPLIYREKRSSQLKANEYTAYYIDPSSVTLLGNEEVRREKLNRIDVYPNPSLGNFTLNLHLKDAANVQVTVLDLNGRAVIPYRTDYKYAGSSTMDFSTNLDPGIYIVQVQSGEELVTKRIVIR